MRIELDISKSVQENAERYFESAKKAKRKAKGAREAVDRLKEQGVREHEAPKAKSERPRRWFMDYRWHITASGVLCVGGRSAESNERLVKRYANAKDRIFHTDVQGSPFYVARTQGKELSEEEYKGVANACASFSRAWKYGLASIEVFEVGPEQVSKRARAGEYVSTGSFMIYGERTYHHGELELYATVVRIDEALFVMVSGERLDESFVRISPGDEQPSQAAHTIARESGVPVSDVERVLPPGPVRLEVIGTAQVREIGRVE